MSDIFDNDLTINPGTGGANIATDYDGFRHFQVVKVAFGDNSSTERVSSTNPLPIVLNDASGNALSVTSNILDVNVNASSPLNVNISSINPGFSMPVFGMAGATAVSVSSVDLDIRSLTAGNLNGTNPSDSVSVVGVVGAYPVGITASNFSIRGLSGGHLGGTGPQDTVSVIGVSGAFPINSRLMAGTGSSALNIGVSNNALNVFAAGGTIGISNTVNVTATNLDIRDLVLGTPSESNPAGYDGVRVAGISGAYPVPALLYGSSGPTLPVRVGMSGDRLKVDIGSATFTGTVNVNPTVSIDGVVNVRGSTLATSPLWVAGGTIAGTAIKVNGPGTNNAVVVEGTVGGVAVGITASSLSIRGLTFSGSFKDIVGISGEAYVALDQLRKQVFVEGSTSIPTFLLNQLNALNQISTKTASGNTESPGLAEVLYSVTQTSNFNPTQNAVRTNIVNSNNIPVAVKTVDQPDGITNANINIYSGEPTKFNSFVCKSGVMFKAMKTNTDTVFVGKYDAINGLTSNGFPLEPGESIYVEIDNLEKLGAQSLSGTQKIRYIVT